MRKKKVLAWLVLASIVGGYFAGMGFLTGWNGLLFIVCLLAACGAVAILATWALKTIIEG